MPEEIRGEFQCVTGFSLPRDNGIRLYPEGRHLRGAMGYIALNLGLSIAEKFRDLSWDAVIFRDLLPRSRCGGAYRMKPDGRFEDCPNCGDNYDARMIKTVRAKNSNFQEIKEGRKYRLSIIIQDESDKDDIFTCLAYIKENGLSIGKRISAGYGKFHLLNYHAADINPLKGRGMLSSDCIGIGKKDIIFSKYDRLTGQFQQIKEKGCFRGTFVEIDGFYAGKYGGLGFGEVVRI